MMDLLDAAARLAGSRSGGVASQRLTDRARLSFETVISLFTSGQDTALLLEVGHRDCWECRGSVVLSCIVVHLMDGNCRVDDVWFDRRLVDDWLGGVSGCGTSHQRWQHT